MEQGETPHRETIVAIVAIVGRIGVVTVEVQDVRVARAVRRRRPIVTVAADIVDTAGVRVPAPSCKTSHIGKRSSFTFN